MTETRDLDRPEVIYMMLSSVGQFDRSDTYSKQVTTHSTIQIKQAKSLAMHSILDRYVDCTGAWPKISIGGCREIYIY